MSATRPTVHFNLDLAPLPFSAVQEDGRAPESFAPHIVSPTTLGRLVGLADAAGFASIVFPGVGAAARPVQTLASVEASTAAAFFAGLSTSLGLVAAVRPPLEQPYNISRQTASLDHASQGRAGWLVSTLDRDVTLDRLDEFVDVVTGLWDGWDEDAIVIDRTSEITIAPERVRPLAHSGRHYRVQGPISSSRPPQGHPPLFVRVDGTAAAIDFAGRRADIALVAARSFEEARSIGALIKARAEAGGREASAVRVLATVAAVPGETSSQARTRLAALTGGFELEGAIALADAAAVLAATLREELASGAIDGISLAPLGSAAIVEHFVRDVLPAFEPAPAERRQLRDHYRLSQLAPPSRAESEAFLRTAAQ